MMALDYACSYYSNEINGYRRFLTGHEVV